MSGVNLQSLSISSGASAGVGAVDLTVGQAQQGLSEFDLLLNMLSNPEGENPVKDEEREKKSQQSFISSAEEETIANSFQASSVSVILETKVFQNIHDVDSSIFNKDSENLSPHIVENFSEFNTYQFEIPQESSFENSISNQELLLESKEVNRNSGDITQDLKTSNKNVSKENVIFSESLSFEDKNYNLVAQEIVSKSYNSDEKIPELEVLNAGVKERYSQKKEINFEKKLELSKIETEEDFLENKINIQTFVAPESSRIYKGSKQSSNLEGTSKHTVKTIREDVVLTAIYKSELPESAEFNDSNFDAEYIRKIQDQEKSQFLKMDKVIEKNEAMEFRSILDEKLAPLASREFEGKLPVEGYQIKKSDSEIQEIGKENLNKINLSLRSISKSSKKEIIKIELNPKDLGSLLISFEKDKETGLSKVTFATEKFTTLDLLAKSSQEIQKIISDSGIKLDDSSLKFEMQNNSDRQESSNKYFEDKVSGKNSENKINEYKTNYSVILNDDEINIIA